MYFGNRVFENAKIFIFYQKQRNNTGKSNETISQNWS